MKSENEISEEVHARFGDDVEFLGATSLPTGVAAEFTPEQKSATGARLRSFIERVERLEEDKKGIMDDIKEVFAEAKSDGFDVKIMRQIIRIRKMEPDDRAEAEALLETYLSAIGM